MDYQTFEPCEDLLPFIKCFWTLEGPADTAISKQKILPDGCMEMIFHYGDLYEQYREDGTSFMQPRCFLYGQITTTLEIAATGTTGIFSVRFHPHGLAPLLGIDMEKLSNKATPLSEVFGKKIEALEQNVLAAESAAMRIGFIENFFLEIMQSQQGADQILKNCVAEIVSVQGNITVDQLASRTDTHRRKLERHFKTHVGLSPKGLSKAVRLQALVKRLRAGEFTTLTDLAYEYGYFDQAHFIKDFKDFTGVSPKQFFADNLQLTTLFSQKG